MRGLQSHVNDIRIVVGKLYGVLFHDAVEHLHLDRLGRVIYETVVYRSGLTVGALPMAYSRVAFARTADVMTVMRISIYRGSLVARHISALKHLLDRDCTLLAVHVAHDEHRNVSELGPHDIRLRHDQTKL